jgi:twitching motility protein PilT
LWKSGLCEERSVITKSNNPGELMTRIERAKKGLFDEEESDEDEDEDH